MDQKIKELLCSMFARWSGAQPTDIAALPPSGSNRKYFRIKNATISAIGVYNADKKENAAFLSFSQSFRQCGIRVPEIYASDEAYGIYLQQDLGDTTLFSLLEKERAENGGAFTDRLKDIYKDVLAELVGVQVKGRQAVDFSKCYPRQAFDRQSMAWDLQYFKYYFLKLGGIAFDEQRLENDFDTLIGFLLEEDHSYFLYRDFQSRNIMVVDGRPWFIDYQGGRYGALQYDVASLLYDAKANIPHAVRNELLQFYISQLNIDGSEFFMNHFYGYVLIRIMQAMGAYGFRGFFERKTHFLKSIPFAIANLSELLENDRIRIDVPELRRVLDDICHNDRLIRIAEAARLKVTVTSFSYKHGIPTDNTGNGGGFVFDCRALPNPGRYEQYKKSTGRDADVVAFFDDHKAEMNVFLNAVRTLVAQSVERYIERGFTNLAINFGCTGGQHRSVFCAETIAKWLGERFDVDVELKHWEQKQLN